MPIPIFFSYRWLTNPEKPANILVDDQCRLQLADFGLAREAPPPTQPLVADAQRHFNVEVTDDPSVEIESGLSSATITDDDGIDGEEEGSDMTHYVVSRWYRAPELLMGSGSARGSSSSGSAAGASCIGGEPPVSSYGAAVDVWSAGCVIAELIDRAPLFPGRDYIHQLRLITEAVVADTPTAVGNHAGSHVGKSLDTSAAATAAAAATTRAKASSTRAAGNVADAAPASSVAPSPKSGARARLQSSDAATGGLVSALLALDPHARRTARQALAHSHFNFAPPRPTTPNQHLMEPAALATAAAPAAALPLASGQGPPMGPPAALSPVGRAELIVMLRAEVRRTGPGACAPQPPIGV